MNYKIGDKVVVMSTRASESTGADLGVTSEMFSLAARTATCEVVKIDTEDNTVQVKTEGNCSYWFSVKDLEPVVILVKKLPEPLTLSGIGIGDEVKLLDQSSYPEQVLTGSCVSFADAGLELAAHFTIDGTDSDDDSVWVVSTGGNCCWVYLKDLTLVEESQEEVSSGTEVVTPEEFGAVPDIEIEDKVSYAITNDSVTLAINGVTYVITADSPSFTEVCQAVTNKIKEYL